MNDREEDYRAHICPDCGGQVRGLSLCRQHDPPGHPVETMMVPKAEVIVLRQQLEGAVVLSGEELHCLICAMAGNFPERFQPIRMDLLRKLSKAHRAGEVSRG